MLTASNVSFAYHAAAPRVVDEVSLTIEPGELTGILGPNGSGKTTLLKMLSGTLTPTSGSIAFEGRALGAWKRRDLARRIALVPQETHAPFDFTVLDIVLMGRFPHLGAFALEGPADLAIAKQALVSTATSSLEDRLFSTLSGGEKQRVVIASALAQSPELLLLDEPTASLDLGHQLDVQMLLAGLNREHGVTMVLSTHDLNLAAALCRQLVLLRGGRVIAQGPTEDVLTPAAVRTLYGVDADIQRHPAGRLTVTPLARVP
jgi:iron complex transport system ATP-binding protein